MDTEVARDFLAYTNDYIMFKIVNGKLLVRNDNQATIYGNNSSNDKEAFHVLSKSIVKELLNKGSKENTIFEMRKELLTVTNGDIIWSYLSLARLFCG